MVKIKGYSDEEIGSILNASESAKRRLARIGTIAWWFDKLPPKIKAAAYKRVREYYEDFLYLQASSLCQALSISFLWRLTPEGFDFWSSVARASIERVQTGKTWKELLPPDIYWAGKRR